MSDVSFIWLQKENVYKRADIAPIISILRTLRSDRVRARAHPPQLAFARARVEDLAAPAATAAAAAQGYSSVVCGAYEDMASPPAFAQQEGARAGPGVVFAWLQGFLTNDGKMNRLLQGVAGEDSGGAERAKQYASTLSAWCSHAHTLILEGARPELPWSYNAHRGCTLPSLRTLHLIDREHGTDLALSNSSTLTHLYIAGTEGLGGTLDLSALPSLRLLSLHTQGLKTLPYVDTAAGRVYTQDAASEREKAGSDASSSSSLFPAMATYHTRTLVQLCTQGEGCLTHLQLRGGWALLHGQIVHYVVRTLNSTSAHGVAASARRRAVGPLFITAYVAERPHPVVIRWHWQPQAEGRAEGAQGVFTAGYCPPDSVPRDEDL